MAGVGIASHSNPLIFAREFQESLAEKKKLFLNIQQLFLAVKSQVNHYLVVTGAASMNLFPYFSERFGQMVLNCRMNVLILISDDKLAAFFKFQYLQ
ncbi:MAG: hypothetical protein DDT31_01308 [Syntrophomonadaceae bacterium]|nr:hypothetical protein [Bacillota bacterium]